MSDAMLFTQIDDLEFQNQTTLAVCLRTPGGRDVWIPKSAISGSSLAGIEGSERGDMHSPRLADWIIEEKELWP